MRCLSSGTIPGGSVPGGRVRNLSLARVCGRSYSFTNECLRLPKFNLGTPTYDQFTVVIILNMASRVMGMVVDSVSDVITLSPEQIKPAPEMGAVLDTDYLIGLGTLDERMLILVDIDKLMTSADMGLIEKLVA